MDHHFTQEELNLFNTFCLREFYMSLDTVRTLVSSGLRTKARNSRGYKRRTQRKKEKEAIAQIIEPEPPQIDIRIDYTEFDERFPKVYSTGMSSSEYFSDKSK